MEERQKKHAGDLPAVFHFQFSTFNFQFSIIQLSYPLFLKIRIGQQYEKQQSYRSQNTP